MYNLKEMHVDILDTRTKNVQSRRDVCRYTGPNNETYNLEEMYVDILDTITKNVQSRRDACRYTGHNNEKCTI